MFLPLFLLPKQLLKNAAWDFYVMGNERAMSACVLELHRRNPKETAQWIEELCGN
jgi:hypothetical protein